MWIGGALVAAGLQSSCTRSTVDPGPVIARQWLDAQNTHDPEQLIALFVADGTYWDTVTPQPLSLDELRARVGELEERVDFSERLLTQGKQDMKVNNAN